MKQQHKRIEPSTDTIFVYIYIGIPSLSICIESGEQIDVLPITFPYTLETGDNDTFIYLC